MSPSQSVDAVVVGAGITGLSCLWRLRRAGIDAIGFEAAARPGGALRTEARDGFLLESGPNTVAGSPHLGALLREVELEGEVVHAQPGLDRFVLRHGRLHRLPGGPVQLLATGLLSTAGKFRLLGEIAVPGRHGSEEESVERFVARRFGREAVDAVAAPFVAGTFAGDPARLSAPSVLPFLVGLERRFGGVLRGMLRGGMRSAADRGGVIGLRGGFSMLVERIAERLGARLRLAQAIERIAANPDGPGFRVASTRRLDVSARTVVLAVPAWAAAGLIAELSQEAAAALGAVEAPPLAIVVLAWPRAQIRDPLRGFGFLTAPGEDRRILGCLWPSSIFAGRAPHGWELIASFVGGARHPDAVQVGDDGLVERVRGELERVLGASGPPRVLSVFRHPRAIPQYTLGHLARIDRLRRAVAAVPGLAVAGNFIDGVAVGDCVRQGFEAASAVERFLKSGSASPRTGVDFQPRSV